MKINSFTRAQKYIYEFIPKGKAQFPGELGLKRAKHFLTLLDNPQEKIKVIHLAGTSGKGSTAYLTSLMLKSLGFKVGLHISPHLNDIRERVQINNKLISQKKFVYYLNQITPLISKMKASPFGQLTYFEIMTGLAFYIFYKEKVNYAVMETGMGGWYDATNVVKHPSKLAIITRIGLDHTGVLGNTLSDIALQKAKIIQPGNPVIAIQQKPHVQKLISKIARQQKSKLSIIKPGNNFFSVIVGLKQTGFDYQFQKLKLNSIKLSMIGFHQAENCSLALTALTILSRRDKYVLDENKIRSALLKANFPGRLEIIKRGNKSIIVDGAHNPQKMASLTKALKTLFPGCKFNWLIAFKRGKDYHKMLKQILPLAKQIFITRFFASNQDLLSLSEKPANITLKLKKLGFTKYKIINNSKEALKRAFRQPDKYLIISGSLYLIAELYGFINNNTGQI